MNLTVRTARLSDDVPETTALIFPPEQWRRLAQLRAVAETNPLDMAATFARAGRLDYWTVLADLVERQSAVLRGEASCRVAFFLEEYGPRPPYARVPYNGSGVCRHMWLTLDQPGRLPDPDGLATTASCLGFTEPGRQKLRFALAEAGDSGRVVDWCVWHRQDVDGYRTLHVTQPLGAALPRR